MGATRITIRNDEPVDSGRRVLLTVVTAGDVDAGERRLLLAPGEAHTLALGENQFAMIDDKEGA